MKIDIVTFDDSEVAMGIYIDGKIYLYGDSYHESINHYIEGIVKGICIVKTDVEIKYHILT